MGQRVPFEATVNRVPGSLFTVDPDGLVRNTYLLKMTTHNPGQEPVEFTVTVEGLPDAEVLAQDARLGPNETVTLPLIVRLPQDADRPRTLPMDVRIVTPEGELLVPATFKSGGAVGGGAGTW